MKGLEKRRALLKKFKISVDNYIVQIVHKKPKTYLSEHYAPGYLGIASESLL